MSESFSRSIWFFILATALAVRLGVGIYWDFYVKKIAAPPIESRAANQDGPFFYGDSDSYWKLARTIAFGRPYEFDEERRWQVFRTPGYPVLLAPLFWIYGEKPPTSAARIEGAFFGTANVALVGWLVVTVFGRSKGGRLVAALAAFFVALDPTEALQSVSILSEEPFMTFSLLLNVELIKMGREVGLLTSPTSDSKEGSIATDPTSIRPLLAYAVKLATFNAAAIYLRPSWFYFLPFSACALLLIRVLFRFTQRRLKTSSADIKRSISRFVLCALLAHIFTLTFLLPWALRNYRVSGKLVMTTLQMGASLYDGLNPEATGASEMSFVDRFRQNELSSPSDSEDVHFEIRIDKQMKKAALEWANSHPYEVLRLAFIKFYRLWSPTPREQSFSNPLLKLALFVSYLPILLLGLLGLMTAVKRANIACFLIIPPLYVTSLHVVFVSSIRYRVPVMYCFSILAAFWLATTFMKTVLGNEKFSPKSPNQEYKSHSNNV